MVDKDRIEQRLMKLENAVRKLKEIASYSWEEYSRDEGLRDRAERNLHIAAQACIDISNHIIADQGFRTPQTYADGFGVLTEESIIPPELAESMKKIAGFRNILVHDYLEINNKMVFSSLKNLDDFNEFAEYVYKMLY